MAIKPHQGDAQAGKWMLWLAAFGFLAGLTALFQFGLSQRGGITESSSDGGYSVVVVKRDRSGHYIATGSINDQLVTFLIDTGATDVALPENIARKLGLDFGPQITVMTAAGPIQAWRTRLNTVSLGNVLLTNVSATITHGPMQEVLLGMSFLKHFDIQQQGEKLIIETVGGSKT